MTDDQDIVLLAARRTPMGGLLGALADRPAPALGAAALAAALGDAGRPPVDEVVMGCVLVAGQGQAPARQAALAAGLGQHVPAVAVNKMCGSGLKAVMDAHDRIRAGSAQVIAAGGMESMSRAPYLVPRARAGVRLGHDRLVDHMFLDGLEDAYEPGRLMGHFADETARELQIGRDEQDDYALESLERARGAAAAGHFATEIVAVDSVDADEQPGRARPEKVRQLKPAFGPEGTVTAANASSISDGAAAVVVARRSAAGGARPLATIRAHATHAQAPAWFATAPAPAIRRAVEAAGWRLDGVDLFEVNEAFAVVALAAMRELSIPRDRLNVHGGACALGHPIGASGARVLVTLVHALRQRGGGRGVASLCIGGGEAVAMAVEV